MNPLHVARILALTVHLVGPRNEPGRRVFAEQIASVTSDADEQRVLTAVAWGENWFHLDSYPPFGQTELVRTHPELCLYNDCTRRDPQTGEIRRDRPNCQPLTIPRAARAALVQIRWIRANRCSSTAPWAAVLRRYGWGGACTPIDLTLYRMTRIRRLTREWGD